MVVLAGLAYLIASAGFPMPTRAARAPGEEPKAPSACGCDPLDRSRGCCCCCKSGCCAARAAEPGHSCCSKAEPDAEEDEAPQFHWVIGLQQQQCRGLTMLWVSSGVTLPPPPPVSMLCETPVAGRVGLASYRLSTVSHPPALPPPRAG
jgi:hypothetical protein